MMAQAVVLSFVITLACLLALLSRRGRALVLDQPNERSLHTRPIPRTGGIALCAGLLAGPWLAGAVPGILLWLAIALAALSIVDDLRGLPVALRLAAHLAAAGALAWSVADGVALAWTPVLALAVAWTTNLYNFMDGSDGLAAGMAVFGFGAYAVAAALAGHEPTALVASGIAAAAAAFLIFNFHPARIFMGDAGSIPLGFLAGAMGVSGWRLGLWPFWFPVLAFAPFLADATTTLLRRLLRGERVWQAHREHYYQRMVRMGLGHRGTAWIAYGFMGACALAALAARQAPVAVQAASVAACAAALAALGCWVDARWARHGGQGSA